MTYEQIISKLENMPNNLLGNDATFLNSDGEVITIVNIRRMKMRQISSGKDTWSWRGIIGDMIRQRNLDL